MSDNTPKASVKDFVFQTIIYGFGLVISKTINFILLPLYTNYFDPADLGVYNLVFSLWAFLMVVYSLGLETSFLRFFIDAGSSSDKTKVYSSILAGTFLTSIVFSSLLYLFSDNISVMLSVDNTAKASQLIKLMSLVMLFDLLSRFPLLLLKSNLKAKTFFAINSIFFVANFLLNVLFIVILGFGIEAIFYCYILSSLISLVIGLISTKKFLSRKISGALFEKMVKFGSSFIFMGLFLIVIEQSDKFFLNYFYNESVVGIYSTCYRLGSIMLLAIMAFKISWTPYFLNVSKDPESKSVISGIFTYFIFAGLMMFLFFNLFLEEIVTAKLFGIEIINEKFWPGLKIIPVVLLAFFFSGLYINLSVIPLFTGKPVYLFVITLAGCILNILLNFILIPKYEMYGAAYSTLISYIFMFSLVYFISQKHYYIRYDWKKISMMTGAVVIICIFNIFISSMVDISKGAGIAINIALFLSFILFVHLAKIVRFEKFRTLFLRKKTENV